jgi:TetR/AcrR family transcriptional regulator
MSRREREKERHRSEILNAACQVFSAKGFQNATIADVSKASEFSIASIYKHFESKEDIYHSLIEDTLQMYYETLEETVKGVKSPLGQIQKAVDTTLDMLQDNRAFLEFFLGEFRPSSGNADDELSRKSMDAYIRLVTFFAGRFAQATEAGEVADFDPTFLSIGLLGNVFTFTMYWIYFQQVDLREVDRSLVSRIFFERIALK